MAGVQALAGQRHSCCQRPEVPAVQEGAAARTLPQAEKPDGVESVVEEPANVPSAPDQVCELDGWQGWGHWLGTGNLRTKEFFPFKEALLCARVLILKARA